MEMQRNIRLKKILVTFGSPNVCMSIIYVGYAASQVVKFFYLNSYFFFSNYFYACMLSYFKCHDFSFCARNYRVVFLTDFI